MIIEEDSHTKGIGNIFSLKIMGRNSLYVEKEVLIKVKEEDKTPKRQGQKRTLYT